MAAKRPARPDGASAGGTGSAGSGATGLVSGLGAGSDAAAWAGVGGIAVCGAVAPRGRDEAMKNASPATKAIPPPMASQVEKEVFPGSSVQVVARK